LLKSSPWINGWKLLSGGRLNDNPILVSFFVKKPDLRIYLDKVTKGEDLMAFFLDVLANAGFAKLCISQADISVVTSEPRYSD
jgi:hypothetical protein